MDEPRSEEKYQKKNVARSISDDRSYRSGSKVKFSPNEENSVSKLSHKSGTSKKSGMTRNPRHYEIDKNTF